MQQPRVKTLLLAACLGGSACAQAAGWSGAYLGLNAGYGRFEADTRSSGAPRYWTGVGGDRQASQTHADSISGHYDSQLDGEVYGIQLGYNWQRDRLLMGIEADLQKSGVSGMTELERVTPVQDFPLNTYTTRLEQQSSIEAMATLRGRLGYAADNWLLYGTAGLAWARVDTRLSYGGSVAIAPQIVVGGLREQESTTRMGWVLGAPEPNMPWRRAGAPAPNTSTSTWAKAAMTSWPPRARRPASARQPRPRPPRPGAAASCAWG